MTYTTTRPVRGRFCSFAKGERVKATLHPDGWFLDRVVWREPLVPLCNQLAFAPRGCVRRVR